MQAGKTQRDADSIIIGVRKVQVNMRGHAFVYLGKEYAGLKGKKVLVTISVLD
ncbi:hypothetical protein [Thermofilum sp.]|uniref:hypothetical protein n=1 Tax=Thermofilum sp. TaxID=1961369 RepID=UPI002589FFBF|nr:hypothetical protein [Thermofilum sp.]